MSEANTLTESTELMMSKFLQNYDIQSINVTKNLNFNNNKEVSDILVSSKYLEDGATKGYSVSFKLQEDGADMHQFISCIEAAQTGVTVQFADSALQLGKEEQDELLHNFVKLIALRVEKAKQEQDVQSIKFVGNTFVLNRSTTFKVLSDEGDGRLNIEIMGGDGLQELMLSAHGLMDGLYTGFIELVEK